MPRRPDFYAHLESPAELQALEAFARKPGRTIDDCHDWLLAKGITASRTAVGRWKAGFDETDRMSAAAELADAIHSASELGTADVAGAVGLQLAQRMQSVIVAAGDDIPPGDLLKMAMAINAISTNQQRVNKLKQQQVEAVKTAEAAAKSGQSATDVVATIKAALGIAA